MNPLAYLKIGSAVAAVLAVVWGANALISHGRESERQSARIEAGKRIIEMEKTNEGFRSLSARDRCLAFMRDSGLPEHHCQ